MSWTAARQDQARAAERMAAERLRNEEESRRRAEDRSPNTSIWRGRFLPDKGKSAISRPGVLDCVDFPPEGPRDGGVRTPPAFVNASSAEAVVLGPRSDKTLLPG